MRIRIFLIFITLLISGCVNTGNKGGVSSLEQLQQINNKTVLKGQIININAMRLAALKETALTVGAQAALAWRTKQIDAILESNGKNLDRAYNFYGLLLSHNVLPPVLVQGNDELSLDGPDVIRLSEKIYKIEDQARFVTAPPTWRDYLWMDFKTPDLPADAFLARNAQEQAAWRFYVKQGWENGIDQANNIFTANLARINRDYKGMVLYRKLYAENMVSAPFVANTNLGITGDASQMRIDDQVLRITALPQLNLQANSWKPAVVPSSPAAAQVAGVNSLPADQP